MGEFWSDWVLEWSDELVFLDWDFYGFWIGEVARGGLRNEIVSLEVLMIIEVLLMFNLVEVIDLSNLLRINE